MEQPFSTSKVTVEYFDPHDVYKLLAPGLIPRLPLRDLNWQSHAGPLRSIGTLHVELVPAGANHSAVFSPVSSSSPNPNPKPPVPGDTAAPQSRDDGFQTAAIGGRAGSTEQQPETTSSTLRPVVGAATKERRHQIPGLRRTPYLKVLLVRCDDNETYKSTTRAEIREWIKTNTAGSQGKSGSHAENHDAFEWLIIHVVLPNSVAATQPRFSGKAPDSGSEATKTSAASRWRAGSSTLLEKIRADFNGSSKGAVDRVRQIRIGINDVPYHMLPRVVPAVPTGYQETEQDSENAWADLIAKFKELILSSFDRRVSQYEEDIKEKDAQRSLPGWNFCTFFILKEGLARGFESVGLVEDALVVYDELSVGLDNVIQEQAIAGSAETHGGALLQYTEDLKELAQKAMAEIAGGHLEFDDEEAVDLQSGEKKQPDNFDSIPISSTKKLYRDLILANNVSLFDFRCYIFSRQIALLLRLANAWSSREELLAKLKEQQELVPRGVAPRTPLPKMAEEPENLLRLAEVCRRTLEFVPAVSAVMRADIISAMASATRGDGGAAESQVSLDPLLSEVVDNMVASFAFSVAQQILAQTSTKALPIPPSTLGPPEGHEQKTSIPEPKTIMLPTRSSSLHMQPAQRPPPSPAGFPGPGRPEDSIPPPPYVKAGLEELAAQRAELCALSRNVLEECGKKRGWTDGWAAVPTVGETRIAEMEDISLDAEDDKEKPQSETKAGERLQTSVAGVGNTLLRTALANKDDFYRLYETLIDKALRHYTVANHTHSVQSNLADLAVLKFHLGEYSEAAFYFYRVIPFFGESGWSLLELSMLVMYARCLKDLGRLDDYVNRALRQLLCKAAAAERDRLQQKSRFRLGLSSPTQYPERSAISGFLPDLLDVSASLEKDTRIPLTSLFCDMGLDGPPFYDDGQDSFSLFLDLYSLLVDEFEATSVRPNKVKVQSTVMMTGTFEVDLVRVRSSKVLLQYERDGSQPTEKASTALKNPRVTLYQRTSCLDVQLVGARDLQLDKKKSLDLELSTGWNEITSCEVKIKSATGGLRLVMSEAEVIGSPQPTKSQGGVFTFGPMAAHNVIKIRFPFTVEQDLLDVAVRAEVTYSTDKGSFTFFKASSVPISLALEVNVQDIFKHDALFSRFAVSTANDSPLRLLKSELLSSDLFESHFGQPPSHPVLVFPKQPASLLYKITRKPGSKLGPKVKKTLYLKLYYSIIQDEIDALFEQALTAALESTPLKEFSKLIISKVRSRVRTGLSAYDLEKATLLGELPTSFLLSTNWEKQFAGLGSGPQDGSGSAAAIATFLRNWLHSHPVLDLPQPEPSSASTSTTDATTVIQQQQKTILIPVDIPPVSVVHTADIRLHPPLQSLAGLSGLDPGLSERESSSGTGASCPTAVVNQLLPATLHLRWTRAWDTAADGRARAQDLEFGYEVSAPADTWLVGGRRRGHFVIPAMGEDAGKEGKPGESTVIMMSSTVETEAEIPLVLIPLREGYLPLPSVEIREVGFGDGEGGAGGPGSGGGGAGSGPGGGAYGHCEMDYKNVGEAVCVVADRGRVTVSLDASGASGGPLVLECESSGMGMGRVVV
ncbi:84f62d9b-9a14-4859-8641-d27b7d119c3d [Thermothielavioides terrestris]|uniref:84f62d9b-9a14-4859-8641-d27b7d119c3d n=1 Tax=Thermothielavioides terrestris TaxID=2587410 RepID=A0A3S4D7K6_9PEZI|nr:84f62d9b-9a14-4859-8641-d27b7d119c3d [Thermothielavioides terrestris]